MKAPKSWNMDWEALDNTWQAPNIPSSQTANIRCAESASEPSIKLRLNLPADALLWHLKYCVFIQIGFTLQHDLRFSKAQGRGRACAGGAKRESS
jgi:hypothetical protein